jgi:uncharacterized protein DUF6354
VAEQTVRVGQLWQDNDPRIVEARKGRRLLRVTHVGPTHAQVETWYEDEIGKNSRTGRVRLARFVPSTTGYRLIEDVDHD